MTFRTLHLVDPELRELAQALALIEVNSEKLTQTRKHVASLVSLKQDLPKSVIRQSVTFLLRDGANGSGYLYQSTDWQSRKSIPAMMHIHGGGLVMGDPEFNDSRHLKLCEDLGITIFAPTYRVAPEHPYPIPLNDCLDAWAWLHGNSGELNIDSSRVALGGDSAGGCLAASMSQIFRDKGDTSIAHLMLLYPMLDSATGQITENVDPVLGEFGWTAEMNQFGWSAYLGTHPRKAPAVPALCSNFMALPPTWIGTAALDLFLDENIKYARKLIASGVSTEFKIYPRAIHGFPMASESSLTKQFYADYVRSLSQYLIN